MMIRHFAILAALSFLIPFMAASVVYAGFEWVPPAGAPNSQSSTMTPPPGSAEPAPLMPVETQPLSVAPVAVAPAAPAQAPITPPPVASIKATTPEEQPLPLLKVKTLADEPAAQKPSADAALKSDDNISWSQSPRRVKPSKPEMPEAAPIQPAAGDLPINAPVSRKIVINPYPEKTTATPVPASGTEDAPASDSAFAPVEGFGSDVPLALALQQIAPENYAFSFGDNVNPGVPISWDGNGKPWNDVIQQAIAPHGLAASVSGKVVHIKRVAADTVSGTPETNPQPDESAIMPEAGEEKEIPAAAPSEMPRGKVSEQPITENDKEKPEARNEGDQSSLEQQVENSTAKSTSAQPQRIAMAEHSASRRNNVIDPGEVPQAQPISMPSTENKQSSAGDAIPLLPDEAFASIAQNGLWEAHAGDSLKDTLHSWSQKAHIGLVWNATHDYTVSADFSVDGAFDTAVQNLIATGTQDSSPDVAFDNDASNAKIASVVIKDKAQ